MARIDFGSPDAASMMEQAGSGDALFALAMVHCNGRHGTQDLVAAHKWFNLAAMQGNQSAKEYRQEIAGDMTAEEIARAQREARSWLAVN